MTDKQRRKELKQAYRENRPEAGVYRIVNVRTGRSLLGSAPNLASVESRLSFAISTRTSGALDRRLERDAREFGLESFTFEVLERLDIRPEMTDAEIRSDLDVLAALWREKFPAPELY